MSILAVACCVGNETTLIIDDDKCCFILQEHAFKLVSTKQFFSLFHPFKSILNGSKYYKFPSTMVVVVDIAYATTQTIYYNNKSYKMLTEVKLMHND